ncbi:MAG: methylated-DNA--[protein]-cysteine S-methyltransferase [Comamonas sp.]
MPLAPPLETAPPASRATLAAQACRLIDAALDAAQPSPSLGELAARLGLGAYRLHRLFKAETGLTPKAYAMARRASRVRQSLAGTDGHTGAPPSITEALYDAGFGASSRFYEHSASLLGMRPADYRAGAPGQDIRFAIAQCTLGALTVARSARGVCAILLGDDPEALAREVQDRFPRARLIGADPAFEQWVAQVIGLVEAPALGLALPLDIRGTAFQERVWRALQRIPPGHTASYADIAQAIGSPRAARAVAQACAANPLAVAVPCHRVVRQDGSLSGYRWGVERKRELLARETRSRVTVALSTPAANARSAP